MYLLVKELWKTKPLFSIRDAVLIPFINCGTSIFAGFVIFSVVGFMSKQAGVDVEDVATAGE